MQIEKNKDFLCAFACARVLATAGYVSAVKVDLLRVRHIWFFFKEEQ
jgi:hypothetical protein